MPYSLPAPRRGPGRLIFLAVALLVLFILSRWLTGWVIDYYWWREVGQLSTWLRLLEIRYLPFLGAWIVVFAIVWIAHARGLKYARARLRDFPLYAWIATAALALLALILAGGAIDGWVVARYLSATAPAAATAAAA